MLLCYTSDMLVMLSSCPKIGPCSPKFPCPKIVADYVSDGISLVVTTDDQLARILLRFDVFLLFTLQCSLTVRWPPILLDVIYIISWQQ